MDPEKEDTYEEMLLVANWAQIRKKQTQDLPAISTQAPLRRSEQPASNCPQALYSAVGAALIKGVLESCFNQ